MSEPVWLALEVLLAIHDEQLAEHGGGEGLRDQGLLESALARPRNLHAYGETSLTVLAASLGFGLARNHPFVDGNKRTGTVASLVFLDWNKIDFNCREGELADLTLSVATGNRTKKEIAAFFQERSSWKST